MKIKETAIFLDSKEHLLDSIFDLTTVYLMKHSQWDNRRCCCFSFFFFSNKENALSLLHHLYYLYILFLNCAISNRDSFKRGKKERKIKKKVRHKNYNKKKKRKI